LATISAAIKLKRSYNEVDTLKKAKKQLQDDSNQPFRAILGKSSAIRKVFDIIEKVANRCKCIDTWVKTVRERNSWPGHCIRSRWKDSVFIGVDMGAITETLFESELFGHKKGSFTDAKDDRAGRFEVANAGTFSWMKLAISAYRFKQIVDCVTKPST
jgi:two-component system response regulator HydG